MAFKFIILATLLACASAGLIGAPLAPAAVSYSAPHAVAYSAPHAVAYSAPQAVAYSAPHAVAYSAPAAVAYSSPALTAAPLQYTAPALTSQSSNIYRSFGNLGQVSTYSKSIDTPFSSVRKSDYRVSNPGLQITAAEHVAQPLLGVAYSAAPAVSHVNYVTGYTHYAF